MLSDRWRKKLRRKGEGRGSKWSVTRSDAKRQRKNENRSQGSEECTRGARVATEWITVSAAFAAAAPAIELSYEPLPEGPGNEIRKVKKVSHAWVHT